MEAIAKTRALEVIVNFPLGMAIHRVALPRDAEQLQVRDRDWQMHFGRQERVGVVELRQEGVEKRRRIDLLRLLEEEIPPVLENAPSHDEHANGHVLPRLEEPERSTRALGLRECNTGHSVTLRRIEACREAFS